MRYLASCSFGKDSLAAILLAKKHGEPLDEAVYCEVMFDKTISGEVPEHRDFIYTKGIPALERMGIKVTVLRGKKTYVDLFTGRITRGPKKGMLRSFPVCGKCYVQRDCKLRPILRYQKTLPPDTVQYIGIAKDEQERLLRLEGRQVSLLEKYNCTEQDAKELCRQAGLLSPIYQFTNRGGCWFCPNAKRKELRHLYDHHPELWARMLELQALPGKVTEKFNRTQRFSDIDAMFREEDQENICKPCLFVFLRNLFYLTFFVAYGDSFSPPKRVLLWSETHPKISKEDALMKKIETHPSPEKLLRQVTEEAVNALALGGPDKIGDEAPMEVGVMLIAKAWGLPQESLQASLDLLAKERQLLRSESGEDALPDSELLEPYDGRMIVELLWGLFETAIKLEDAQDRAAMHKLALLMAESLSLDSWIAECGPSKI